MRKGRRAGVRCGGSGVENTTGKTETLTAKFSDDTSAAFNWAITGTDDVIAFDGATTGSSVTYKPLKVGTTNLTVSSGTVTKVVTITVYEVEKPNLPVSKVETDSAGKTTVSNTSVVEIKDEAGKDVATIKDDDTGVTLKLTFDESGATTEAGKISGNVTVAVVSYPAKQAVSSPEVSVDTKYALIINLGKNVTNLLPEIDPSYNTTVEGTLKSKFTEASKYTFVSMITAKGENVSKINSNVTEDGIEVTFTIPLDWANQITTNNLGKIKAFHVKDDGTVIGPLSGSGKEDNAGNYLFTVKGDSFSSYVLGAYTYTAPYVPPVNPPVSSGSGDGNMDGAYRVLFETQGGSSVTPATGLSAGDKITAPVNPVRDGYTFGGWYKDAACTQAWSFSDGIPGDMTLYAKWTGGSSGAQGSSGSPSSSTQPTAKQTTAPVQTQSQSGASATTAAPVTTTAAGSSSPAMTQAPAPVFGALLGLLAAGVLLRRRE